MVMLGLWLKGLAWFRIDLMDPWHSSLVLEVGGGYGCWNGIFLFLRYEACKDRHRPNRR
jgi:hypothetical protein